MPAGLHKYEKHQFPPFKILTLIFKVTHSVCGWGPCICIALCVDSCRVPEGNEVVGGYERGLRTGIQAGNGICYCYTEKCFCERKVVEGEVAKNKNKKICIWQKTDSVRDNATAHVRLPLLQRPCAMTCARPSSPRLCSSPSSSPSSCPRTLSTATTRTPPRLPSLLPRWPSGGPRRLTPSASPPTMCAGAHRNPSKRKPSKYPWAACHFVDVIYLTTKGTWIIIFVLLVSIFCCLFLNRRTPSGNFRVKTSYSAKLWAKGSLEKLLRRRLSDWKGRPDTPQWLWKCWKVRNSVVGITLQK